MRSLLVMALALVGLATWAALGRADDDAKKKPAEGQTGFLGINLDDNADAPTITGFVGENSPAEKAGLKAGDVIVKVQDKSVKALDELMDIMKTTKPGDKLPVTVKRDGKEHTITVTLGTRSQDND
jgi:S1-C subfamily serine protease